MRGRPRRAAGARSRDDWWTEGPEGDRNGEPCESPDNWQLYAIVLAAMAVVIGFELGLLFWLVR